MNLWCEFVKFDETLLKDLIQKVDSGAVPIQATAVSLRLVGDTYSEFSGTYFGEPEDRTTGGPFEWVGRISDEPKSFAQFIVRRNGRVQAHVSSSEGVFTLAPSIWSDDFFYCKRDTAFRQKID